MAYASTFCLLSCPNEKSETRRMSRCEQISVLSPLIYGFSLFKGSSESLMPGLGSTHNFTSSIFCPSYGAQTRLVPLTGIALKTSHVGANV